MRVKIWGARGSIPVPGADFARFGGNTSCVQVTGPDGTEMILDAGSGIRGLGLALAGHCRSVHVLLTHLHLDHIQGLMFFAPLFDPAVEVTIWGPTSIQRPLRDRLARYLSNPLSPIEIRDLPARVRFADPATPSLRLGAIEVEAAWVSHRGPTLGYRLTSDAASVCYLPDHEPGLGEDLETADVSWISGHTLAQGASLLIHDCQYEDGEYRQRQGWGHSSISDAMSFARRADCQCSLMFHHDPGHDDAYLDGLAERVAAEWRGAGAVGLAREGQVIEFPA
ncbi:MAG TPA: MBL fold metallo-hydrolase [Solirubrobacteraceae bacterium]|nr:MBL fold metallo-hydrolase [Solirubrobacteraceae bacterium]